MPIPQEKITLVGWAEEPVPSIEEKDFCKRSILLGRGARVRVQEAIIWTDDSEPQMLLLQAIEPIFIYLLTRSLLIFYW